MPTKSILLQQYKKADKFLLLNQWVSPKRIFISQKAKPENYILSFNWENQSKLSSVRNKADAKYNAAMEAANKSLVPVRFSTRAIG